MLRSVPCPRHEGPILIRISGPADHDALGRLAALEDRPLPPGAFLVAEVGGQIVAAAAIDADAEPLGDPFRPTADLRELLRVRARRLRIRLAA